MKYIWSLCLILLIQSFTVKSQKVDSIRLEQTGDLIKVHYKILNSNPNQIFRISVLCSVNGGLKSQLNSLSGDFGENVIGGRDDYMILWDVLKDVNELNSVEFFIRADIVKDLSAVQPVLRSKVKGKFHLMAGFEVPGPKGGLRIGYMGNFGISAQLNYGKIPVTDEYEKNIYYSEPYPRFGIGIDLTKRIINLNYFQMHIIGGVRNTDLLVYFQGPPEPQFWRQGMTGPEIGMVFAIKRVVTTIMVSHLDPKQLEKNQDPVVIASPYNLIDICLGVRF